MPRGPVGRIKWTDTSAAHAAMLFTLGGVDVFLISAYLPTHGRSTMACDASLQDLDTLLLNSPEAKRTCAARLEGHGSTMGGPSEVLGSRSENPTPGPPGSRNGPRETTSRKSPPPRSTAKVSRLGEDDEDNETASSTMSS